MSGASRSADWGQGFDERLVGHADAVFEIVPGRDEIRAFASAIGETDPQFLDVAAARNAGYRDLPIPPTYHFSIGRMRGGTFPHLAGLGIDLTRLLHGTQSFTYHAPAAAGDTLTVRRRIADYFTRREGELRFIVIETRIERASTPISTGYETLILPRVAPRPSGSSAPETEDRHARDRDGSFRPGQVTAGMLAAFARASGDMNPVHLDPAVARKAGYRDVFAHGMLAMAWIGRALTRDVELDALKHFAVRFNALVPLGSEPAIRVEPMAPDPAIASHRYMLTLDLAGQPVVSGEANLVRALGQG